MNRGKKPPAKVIMGDYCPELTRSKNCGLEISLAINIWFFIWHISWRWICECNHLRNQKEKYLRPNWWWNHRCGFLSKTAQVFAFPVFKRNNIFNERLHPCNWLLEPKYFINIKIFLKCLNIDCKRVNMALSLKQYWLSEVIILILNCKWTQDLRL